MSYPHTTTLYPGSGSHQARGVTRDRLDAAPNAARLISAIESAEGTGSDVLAAAFGDAWDHVFTGEDMGEAEVRLWLVACGLEGR